MRIVQLCRDRGVPYGGSRKGASVHLQEFAGGLLRRGHEVAALCADVGDVGAIAELTAAGLVLDTLPASASIAEIRGCLERLAPALVVERLSLAGPEGALAARELDVPHVYEVNAPLDEEAARHRDARVAPEVVAGLERGFAASRGAVAVSGEVAAWVERHAPAGFPVVVEPNGAGPIFFEPPTGDALARAQRFVPPLAAEFRVGFVGAFRPWHDVPALIDAVARAQSVRPTRLVLVGDGPSREDLLQRARSAGAPVTFVGSVPHSDVPAYLAVVDAVAVPYASAEAYFSPLKLFEAMAAGRPIVASATRPVARVAEHGREALLVAPGDVPALADALLELASDSQLRARLGAAARYAAEACHTWEAVAERVIRFALRCPRRAEHTCDS